MTATIEELTKKLAGLKEDAAKDEAAAAKSIETLPGTAGNKTPAGGKKPAGPTTGITDVATTIIKATEEAKNKRTTCARASKRLTNQKDSISVEITTIKDDIEENKKLAAENQDTLKKEHEEYAKTQADANAIASRDPSKYEELTLKLRTLQLQLEQEGKKVNDDEENVERMMSKIKDKNEEVNGLVKFVNDACQDAGQAEEEV
jgi:DNA repair exonuclease SbcCD ATPase subunit